MESKRISPGGLKINIKKRVFLFIFFLPLAVSETSAESFNWVELHNRVYESPGFDFKPSTYPYSSSSAYMFAVDLLTRRIDDEAEKWFKITKELKENGHGPKWGIAEIYRRRRLFSESISILKEVIDEKPGFAPALVTKAYIHFEKGNYSQAISLAERIISMEERIDRANLIRAHLIAGGAKGSAAMESSIFGRISRGLAARRHLREARELDPDYPGVLFAWGSYYLMAPRLTGGNMSKAKRHLYRALEKDPDFADIHATIAKLYFMKGDIDSYDQYAKQAELLDPGNTIIKELKKMKEEKNES